MHRQIKRAFFVKNRVSMQNKPPLLDALSTNIFTKVWKYDVSLWLPSVLKWLWTNRSLIIVSWSLKLRSYSVLTNVELWLYLHEVKGGIILIRRKNNAHLSFLRLLITDAFTRSGTTLINILFSSSSNCLRAFAGLCLEIRHVKLRNFTSFSYSYLCGIWKESFYQDDTFIHKQPENLDDLIASSFPWLWAN